jgi:hypothetical protein
MNLKTILGFVGSMSSLSGISLNLVPDSGITLQLVKEISN